jgi:hypothetical protein
MIYELYLLFTVIAFLFFGVSVFKKDVIVFAWIPTILFFVLAVGSYNIEYNFCDMNATLSWDCHTETYMYVDNSYLYYGMGIVSFIYAIYITLTKPLEESAEMIDNA